MLMGTIYCLNLEYPRNMNPSSHWSTARLRSMVGGSVPFRRQSPLVAEKSPSSRLCPSLGVPQDMSGGPGAALRYVTSGQLYRLEPEARAVLTGTKACSAHGAQLGRVPVGTQALHPRVRCELHDGGRQLRDAPPVGAVQEDAVEARDSTAAAVALVVANVLSRDPQCLQGLTHLRLLVIQLIRPRRGQPLAAHALVEGPALGWLWVQQPLDEAATRPRHPGRHGVGTLQNESPQLGHGLSPEGHGACHHEEKNHAECPHIHVDAHVALIAKELRRCVRWRTAERVQHLVAAAECAEAEVAHLDQAAVAAEHVLGLQVPVNNAVLVLRMSENG
ncbi:hypothetical protein Z043_112766 [Scleropages formosus]|uniref:Uncharacterized protein n=1 Tax=Scleropages formosus TaxID=113540 RepID=A0A0P7V5V0_SCLFO|nr:hypothetical protein Z043_112766 [Scleropages formosus]